MTSNNAHCDATTFTASGTTASSQTRPDTSVLFIYSPLVRTAMGALAPAADVGGFGQQLVGAGLQGGTEAANAAQEAAQEAAQRERRTTAQLTEPVKRFESPPGQARVDVQDLTKADI